MTKRKNVAIIGAGGHARVVAEALLAQCATDSALGFAGFIDKTPTTIGQYLGTDEDLPSLVTSGAVSHFVLGLGSIIGGRPVRGDLFSKTLKSQAKPFSVIHPRAYVSNGVQVDGGAAIMAGAIINTGTVIGENAIINTGCVIDHDCRIGAHAHVGPGAAMSGDVVVGAHSLVGVGASVRQGCQIGKNVTIGAGSVVVAAVPDGVTVKGNPAR